MTRSPGEIGSGLAAARDPRPIAPAERIHVVGAAGAGASGAALLAHRAGAIVSGCDPGGHSPYTAALAAAGIPVAAAHDPAHVTREGDGPVVDRLAVTKALTSVQPDHPELVAARAAGVPTEAWQQVIADAAESTGATLVAVAGTHGKSTSAGWLVHLLVRAGREPSAFVGALLDPSVTGSVAATARWGSGDAFVVEADEYAGNFDPYLPDVLVLLNAEWDHPDVFADHGAVLDCFEGWVRRASGYRDQPDLVVNVADSGAATIAARLEDWQGHLLVVALIEPDDDPARARAALGELYATALGPAETLVGRLLEGVAPGGVGSPVLELTGLPGGSAQHVRLALAGGHNAMNALCVAGAAAALGVPDDRIADGLATFRGVGRRLELKGEPHGVTVLDDYGHHPTAITATLAAVRGTYPGRRVWAAYEPLTFHRTAAMLEEFAEALARADRAVIADIWAGRDPDVTVASAQGLADAISRRSAVHAEAPGSVEATAQHLASRVQPGDVVLVMGGGRSYVIAERLVELLGGTGAESLGPPTADR